MGRYTLAIQREFTKRGLTALNYSIPKTAFVFELSPDICDFTITEIMAGVFDIKPVKWVTTLADPYGHLRQCAE